eukprot:3922793-Prymnesium_polylepis.2
MSYRIPPPSALTCSASCTAGESSHVPIAVSDPQEYSLSPASPPVAAAAALAVVVVAAAVAARRAG